MNQKDPRKPQSCEDSNRASTNRELQAASQEPHSQCHTNDPNSQQARQDANVIGDGDPVVAITSVWLRTIHKWFPKLHNQTYFVPPLHFNRVCYSNENVADQLVLVPHKAPNQRYDNSRSTCGSACQNASTNKQRKYSLWPCHSCKLPAVFKSDVQEDLGQQRVLQFLRDLDRSNPQVMVVVSQLDYTNYLRKQDPHFPHPSSHPQQNPLPRPDSLGPQYRRGDFDVLIVHARCGLIVWEVKSVGADVNHARGSKLAIAKRIQKAVHQLEKAEYVLKHLVDDLGSVRVTKVLACPFISSGELAEVLEENAQLQTNLCQCLNTGDVRQCVSYCFCSDQLDSGGDEWWQNTEARARPDSVTAPEIYEQLVARFCGPATPVKVCTLTSSRLDMKQQSAAIAEVGRRMSLLVLHPDQVCLVKSEERMVFLCGPPGTGKTIVLVLKSLQWLKEGNDVHVVSLHRGSRAVSFVIEHQLRETLRLTSPEALSRVHLHIFDLEKAGNVQVAVNAMAKFAFTDGSLYVIVDEAGPEGAQLANFCRLLHDRLPFVYLWAAGVKHTARPPCMTERQLTVPLRNPPAVHAEVACCLDTPIDVYPYTDSPVPAPTDGPRVLWRRHQGQSGHSAFLSEDCPSCGHEIAVLLDEMGVDKAGQSDLTYRDVLVIGYAPRADSGMVRGLQERGVPVQVLRTDDNDETFVRQVALALNDNVTVAGWDVVAGLERKVVIGMGSRMIGESLNRLYCMSRSNSQLVWFE